MVSDGARRTAARWNGVALGDAPGIGGAMRRAGAMAGAVRGTPSPWAFQYAHGIAAVPEKGVLGST